MKKLKTLLPGLLLLLFSACQKKNFENLEEDKKTVTSRAAVPPYVFNWETSTYMPTSTPNTIPMPWNSGTTAIDPSVANDYKKEDGWVLTWSTFSPTHTPGISAQPSFFSLYNRYRGILRFYIWQQGAAIASTYVAHGLKEYSTGTKTTLLNYNASDFVDFNHNIEGFYSIYYQPINLNGGTWYVFDYEMAYSPAVASTSSAEYGLSLDAMYVSVSQLSASGYSTSTVTGTIGASPKPSVGQFIGGVVLDAVGSFAGNSNLYTGKWKEAVASAAAGAAKNVLNGIVKGTGGSAGQNVRLTISQDLQLSGSVIGTGGLLNIKLAIPGQSDIATANGDIPDYKDQMGVFNLSESPVLYLKKYLEYFSYEDPQYPNQMTTDVDSVMEYYLTSGSTNVIWNPNVINSNINGASIQNFKREVLIYKDPKKSWPVYGPENGIEEIGNKLNIVAKTTEPSLGQHARYSYMTQSGMGGPLFPPIEGFLIRISFDVVPNNGAASSKIIKTFRPRLVSF